MKLKTLKDIDFKDCGRFGGKTMKTHPIKDKICEKIVELFPKRILYWVIIRVWAKLTCTIYSNKHPDEVTWNMALKNLDVFDMKKE